MLKKKIWVNCQKYRTFNPKNCHQTLKNMRLGSRGQKGTENPGSATLVLCIQSRRSILILNLFNGTLKQ
jgi:hypothetical protein